METNKKLCIVKNRVSDYKIIYPENSSKAILFAATELSEFIYKAIKVKLSVAIETFIKDDKFISIGFTELFNKSNLNINFTSLNTDGFIIKSVGNSIYINGESDRSVIYGVYEFLERFLNIRFLTPEKTHIPTTKNLCLDELNIQEVPSFVFRNFLNFNCASNALFALRKRMSNEFIAPPEEYGGTSGWYTGCKSLMHNTLEYVSPDLYLEKHPEMFSVINGVPDEICLTSGITSDGEIDYSQEMNVAKALLIKLKSNILADKTAKFFMIGQMDGPHTCCKCENCIKAEKENGGRSGTMLKFFNAIAREIQKWADETLENRKIVIVNFAYVYTDKAPVVFNEQQNRYFPINKYVKAEKNLYIRLAPFYADQFRTFNDENQNPIYHDMLKSWSAISDSIMIWDYALNHQEYFWYLPTNRVLKDNYILYEKSNVKYVMTQSTYSERNDFQADIRCFITSKHMWNPNKYETEDLLKEFLDLYYGSYAKDVYEFMQIMERFYEDLAIREPLFRATVATVHNEVYTNPSNYPYELLKRGEDIIDNAIDMVQKSKSSKRNKTEMTKNLNRVLLCPIRMLLRNIEAYSINDVEKERIKNKFFEIADNLGVIKYEECDTIESLKKKLNYLSAKK